MKIVGVGAGPGMLTIEAIEAIARARLIFGSGRAIELASAYIDENCQVREIKDYGALRTLPEGAVVLSTGDPLLAGLGYLGGEIIPGISSMQVACARLGLPLTKAAVVHAHGRDHATAVAEAAEEVRRGKLVFIIADPEFDVRLLSDAVAAVAPSGRIAICEHLGYPDERIAVGSVTDPPAVLSDLFVVVAGEF